MDHNKQQEQIQRLNDFLFNLDLNEILKVNVHITSKNDLPAVQLRKISSNMDVIKQLSLAALQNRPVILVPKFKDKIKGINSLLQKGIIFQDDNGEYKFNF